MKKEAKEMAATKEKSCLKKNLLWVILGCVIGIVLIVVIVLLSTRKAGNRQQYKECWSNDTVWSDIETLTIPDWVCNEESDKDFDLTKYPRLKSVVVGDYCFKNVDEVRLIGLNELESVVIGDKSFPQIRSEKDVDPTKEIWEQIGYNRHVYLKNCPKLKSLTVGIWSFLDFTVCEIENMHALERIEIGQLNNDSCNFYYDSSLELKSVTVHSA